MPRKARTGKQVTSSKDLILILLYAKGARGQQCEPIRGRTRLMKMVFLFKREVLPNLEHKHIIPSSVLPKFEAYDFGPFSAQVFSDLEFLVELEFVDAKQDAAGEILPEETLEYSYWQAGTASEEDREDPPGEEEFRLTALGREFVSTGEAGAITPGQWRLIDEFKARCTRAPLRALLKYIYSKYPAMATKSKIRDEVLSRSPY
jgi:hypothetical protein